jgi:hypothetical protein
MPTPAIQHHSAVVYDTGQCHREFIPVLLIRIHKIRILLGLIDPDPSVRVTDPAPGPDPSIIKHCFVTFL